MKQIAFIDCFLTINKFSGYKQTINALQWTVVGDSLVPSAKKRLEKTTRNLEPCSELRTTLVGTPNFCTQVKTLKD